MSAWWQRPQRIVQTNLRLIDAHLDPGAVATELAEFGATAMLFNVGGIFAWYSSELELQARNPLLDRDLLGEMIEAAHAADIRVIGRYDLSKATRPAFEKHPEWFCRDKHGNAFEYNGTYQACVNGGWYREQAPALLRETLSRYPLDGLFFNMFGYQRSDYSYTSYGVCQCDSCRHAFLKFAGLDLPRSYDPAEPSHCEYLHFQEVTAKALAAELRALVKSIRPDVAISNMGKDSDFFRGEINRRLDRPREWVHGSGEQARTFRSMGANRIRYSSALTHFVDFPWRYASESGPQQALRLAQQLANGADPHYYVMGTLNQPDREPLDEVRRIFRFHADNADRYANLESEATVALYLSSKSARYDGPYSARAFRGAYQALIDSGVVFDIVHDTRASDVDFVSWHKRYDVIVLAGATCMSEEEARALDAYVKASGTLLAIGGAGSRDEKGLPLPSFRLTCLPVSGSFAKRESMRGGYMEVEAGTPLGVDTDVILLDGPYYELALCPHATKSHKILLPQRFGPPELCYPESDSSSELPGVISGTFGDGQAVLVPWQPDSLYLEQCLSPHRELISTLVNSLARAPRVWLEGASRTELTVQRQIGSGDLLIHVINYSGQIGNGCTQPVTIHNAVLHVRDGEGMTCRALVDGEAVALGPPDADGVRSAKLPPIGTFETLWLSNRTN